MKKTWQIYSYHERKPLLKRKNSATNSLSPTCSDVRAIRLLDTVHILYAAAELDWLKPSERTRIP